MSNDLRDRLADLATHTPVAAPPADLWDRGVRRRRVDRAITGLLIAVVVLLLAVGGWSFHAQRDVQPVDTHGAAHLPDRFFDPSPWMSSFAAAPGPLVAIGSADHKSLLHSRRDVYGVTASDGQYGFLDLPDLADRGDYASAVPPALSPDGRYVAFWMTGAPSGSANTQLYGQTITGIGVYDATTGRTRTSQVSTRHGLAPESLVWSDQRTLVMLVGQTRSGDANRQRSTSEDHLRLLAWRLESPRPVVVDAPADYGDLSPGKGFVVSGQRLVWPRDPARDTRMHAPVGTAPALVVSPFGTRVANVAGARNPNNLQVGRINRPGRATMRPVNRFAQYYRPLVWTDRQHVVAVARNRSIDGPLTARLELVDVRSGSRRILTNHLPGGGNAWDNLSFASDLLTSPSTHAESPPHAWNLRGVAIGVLALLVGLLLLGFMVRRYLYVIRPHRA